MDNAALNANIFQHLIGFLDLWTTLQVSQTCKKLKELCQPHLEYSLRSRKFDAAVQRVEVLCSRLLCLTEFGTLYDAEVRDPLFRQVCDFDCKGNTLVLSRRIGQFYQLQKYVWPNLSQPCLASENLMTRPRSLQLDSVGARALCLDDSKAFKWNFDSVSVDSLPRTVHSPLSIGVDRDGSVVVEVNTLGGGIQRWKNEGWSEVDKTPHHPLSTLWCQLENGLRAEVKGNELWIGERCVQQLQPRHHVVQLSPLEDGKLLLVLHSTGQLDLWRAAGKQPKILSEGWSNPFQTNRVTIGANRFAYVKNQKTLCVVGADMDYPECSPLNKKRKVDLENEESDFSGTEENFVFDFDEYN